MTEYDILSDDYVASLLVDEAKHGASGSGAFPAEKRPANMPRPNTRFLKNILKAGAREAERPKEPQPRRRESSHKHRDPELRKRQMSDIQAILGGPSKRRDRDDGRRSGRSDRDRGKSEKRRRDGESSKQDNDLLSRESDDRRRHGRLSEDKHTSRKDDERRSRRSRRDADGSSEERAHRHKRSRRDRSNSPRRHRSRSRERTRRHRERSRHDSPSRDEGASRRQRAKVDNDDSDHDNIGPAPPPTLRGRGTIGGAADLDRRFSESYDPKLDVEPESDGGGGGGGDWDDAVEAFRDRVKLKMNQEKRMRDAGFAEDQIRRITQGGEKTEKDVVWTKAGEKRAWDQGKEVDGGGDAEMEVPPTLFSEDY